MPVFLKLRAGRSCKNVAKKRLLDCGNEDDWGVEGLFHRVGLNIGHTMSSVVNIFLQLGV